MISTKIPSMDFAVPNKKLSPELRASLDVARATAGIYVAVHHAANHFQWPFFLRLTFAFGQEAVMIFFLLSGFVIYANEFHRVEAVGGYLWRRIKRIYPCLLVSMLLSVLVALDNGDLAETFKWDQLFGTLANLQDQNNKPGVIVEPFMENGPLWSLSYEMLFYLIFPVAMIIWKKLGSLAHHIIGALSILAYILYLAFPNHWALVLSYFVAWWCGAMIAQAYMLGATDFRAIRSALSWLGGLCVVAGAALWYFGYYGLAYFPFVQMRHFIVTFGTIIIFFGPIGKLASKYLVGFAKPAAYLASISYGIYVLHVPVMMRWDRMHSATGLLFTTTLTILLSIVFDRWLTMAMKKPAKQPDPVSKSI